MMNQELNSILKFEKLNNVMAIIEKYMEEGNFKEAYYKAAAMLEFVNANLAMKKFKIKIDDTDIINFIEIYNKEDKELSRKMISINGEYNNIDSNKIRSFDVEYLLLKIDDILEYIINTYGYDFLK